ncbi:MAG: hypothetical protein MK135_09845 [Polyangiaceae bacterium]|nr:hypothetical protein [Polyangiaceae bacterium]
MTRAFAQALFALGLLTHCTNQEPTEKKTERPSEKKSLQGEKSASAPPKATRPKKPNHELSYDEIWRIKSKEPWPEPGEPEEILGMAILEHTGLRFEFCDRPDTPILRIYPSKKADELKDILAEQMRGTGMPDAFMLIEGRAIVRYTTLDGMTRPIGRGDLIEFHDPEFEICPNLL